ncbi:MAG: hypothetical protein ACI9JL_003186 [Paracoccaceae bacterium]
MKAAFRRTPDGIRLFVQVTPRASRSAISGTALDADSQPFLKIMVTAPAEGGKANTAVIKLLSKAWKVPKSAIDVAGGAKSRRKTLDIAGNPDALAAAIELTMGKTGESTENV